MKNKLVIFMSISFLGVLMAGCTPHTNYVMGDSSNFPQTAKAYYAALAKSKMMEDEKIIPLSYSKVKSRLRKVSKRCYRFSASHTRRGAEQYRQGFTGKVTSVARNKQFSACRSKA